ncbi:MAG: DUF4405 domain-containing protein [Deltaproteobacteria bacterium]|nr:DUF4405 domain-containing protein [Deltaproteobacteria bacterium]
MAAILIAHNFQHLRWYRNLAKGRYSAQRIIALAVTALSLAALVALVFSGLAMSNAFGPLGGWGLSILARKLHILGAYWGFPLISLHLGSNWNAFICLASKRLGHPKRPKAFQIATFVSSLAVSAYGIHVFLKRDFISYMFLKSDFVFFDFGEPKLNFILEYLSIMILCVFIAHYGSKIMIKVSRKKGKGDGEAVTDGADRPRRMAALSGP